MSAELGADRVGPHNHRQRVPSHQRAQSRLDLEVARKRRLIRERDRVQVRRVQYLRQRHPAGARVLQQMFQHKRGAFGTDRVNHCVQRIQPLTRFLRVGVVFAQPPRSVWNQLCQVVEIHREIIRQLRTGSD